MAGIVPDAQQGAIDFFSSRLTTWAANAASIGLSAGQVTDIAQKVSDAQDRLAAALAARNASKSATLDLANAMADMRSFGGDVIKVIRNYAEITDDDNVYVLGDIPPVSPPTPAGPPEQPTELAASILLPFGLGLSWKGSIAQGTYFGVWRRISGESNYTLIGTSKTKTFDDQTLPAGTDSVNYSITAYRDEFSVASQSITVQIGANGTTALSLAA